MTEEHMQVMGICYPNKCYVPVPTKREYDITAAKTAEHEERLSNITAEVDGALSCESVTTSGTITSTGKIKGNGGIDTTALTAGTITASGVINANSGIVGNVTGNLYGDIIRNYTMTPLVDETNQWTGNGVYQIIEVPPFCTVSGSIKIKMSADNIAEFGCRNQHGAHYNVILLSSKWQTINFSNARIVYINIYGTSGTYTAYHSQFNIT